MITVTRGAKEVLRSYQRPEGTALRLDPVDGHHPAEFRARLGTGKPRRDDQVVEHDGEELLRIASPVSKKLSGSTLDLVETVEGPAVGIKPPPEDVSLTDGP